MKAPQAGTCRSCGKPYRKGSNVAILTINHIDSPLVRLVHRRAECLPDKGRKIRPHLPGSKT